MKNFNYFPLTILAALLTIFTTTDLTAQQSGKYSIFVAGDAIITQRWSSSTEKTFTDMIAEIRKADAAIINLEMLIHDYKGYAQANSGGTYMSARPVIAEELAWAGVDMVGNANNHSFDFGSIGVLETLENIEHTGIRIAGVGKDLQRARMPVYYSNNGRKIGLISMASTFTAYGIASRSRADIHGRPGLNPLTVNFIPTGTVSRETADKFVKLAKDEGVAGVTSSRTRLRFLGKNIPIGSETSFDANPQVDPKDLEGNLNSIRAAVKVADIVALSIHAHTQGQWLTDFAHQSIDEGVDIFFTHGPHEIRGIEIYKGKPIFYSMGDFVFQNEQIEKLPSEFYDRYNMDENAIPVDVQNRRSRNGTVGFPSRREPWESVVAIINYEGEDISTIKLIPLDLGFGKPVGVRGKPQLADKKLGKYIIEYAAEKSKPFGTKIEYDSKNNVGIIRVKK